MKRPLHVLVVGSGMYVCGKGTDGYGTIMPAVFEWSRTRALGDVYVAGASLAGVKTAKLKIAQLEKECGVRIPVKFFPVTNGRDPHCYREAIDAIPRPAAAIVAVPDHLHREVAGRAIEGGLHTLVAKPLAPTLKEVRELVALQRMHGVH